MSRWRHEQEGADAFERGRSSSANPYDRNGEYEERQANQDWDYGYRRAEDREREKEREQEEREQQRDEDARCQEEMRAEEEAWQAVQDEWAAEAAKGEKP